jgi:diguanylate cyclase (GGDEF)-like protein
VSSDEDTAERASRLEEENESLRGAILLLHRIANLVRTPMEVEATCYALLTGVTAGVGLGLNRAMILLVDETDRRRLKGAAAVGPADAEEADRVWRSIEADAPELETLYEAGLAQHARHGKLDQRVRSLLVDVQGASPVALAMRSGALVAGLGDDDLDGLLDVPTSVAAPLRGRGVVRGVLYADNVFTGRKLPEVAQLVFALLADHAGRALEGARRYEQVAQDARTDALTGLGHHGVFMEELGRAVGRAAGRALGLVMIDLDDFKRVNDTPGHLAGDALLAGVAERMRGVVRTGESPYRYGGEEFAVVLPGADLRAAAAVGERIRRAVGGSPYAVSAGVSLSVTCSVGVASLAGAGHSAVDLVAAADAALLRAKAAGKDRVVTAGS